MAFNPKTNKGRYVARKNKTLKELPWSKTWQMGLLIGCLMVIIPILLLLTILFLPRLIEYIVLLIKRKDAYDEILIIQRFTNNWHAWFFYISLSVTTSGLTGMSNALIRKAGFLKSRYRGAYLKGYAPWGAISVTLLFLIRNAKLNLWGIFFLALLGGWFFKIPYMAYFLYLEDLLLEKFFAKNGF